MEKHAKSFHSKYETFPLKDRVKAWKKIFWKHFPPKLFSGKVEHSFENTASTILAKVHKFSVRKPQKKYKTAVFLYFVAFVLVFWTHKMTFNESMLRKIELKVWIFLTQGQRQNRKPFFPDKISIRNIVLDTYNA